MSSRLNSQFVIASVNEFITVWALGGTASLSLTTSNGQATVGLNCTLRQPGAPPFLPSSPPPSSPPNHPLPTRRPRHRGPAEMDKNRKRAACHQAAMASHAASTASVSPPSQLPTVPVTFPTTTASVKGSTTTASVASSNNTAPVTSSTITGSVISSTSSASVISDSAKPSGYKCDLCDFKTTSKHGLSVHIGRAHQNDKIDQIDGFSESVRENLPDPEIGERRKMDLEVIDQDCLNLLGITEKCMISCNQRFETKEECYKHMYVSPSKCCQKLRSNMEKNGFAEDIKKIGFQKVMLNHTMSQIM